MKSKRPKYKLSNPFLRAFEGGNDDPPANDPPVNDPPANDPPGITFTPEQQAHLNKLLANERRSFQEKVRNQLVEVENLRTKASLTAEEKKDLETKYEQLQQSLHTKEELTKRERERAKKEREEEVSKLTKERDAAITKYTKSTIDRTITEAAVAHKGRNPNHFIRLLGPDTQLIINEETQAEEVVVKFEDKDSEGKRTVLTLPVKDAIKRMTEMEEHEHLFEGFGAGGVGRKGNDGKDVDLRKLIQTDPERYMKLRDEGKLPLQGE